MWISKQKRKKKHNKNEFPAIFPHHFAQKLTSSSSFQIQGPEKQEMSSCHQMYYVKGTFTPSKSSASASKYSNKKSRLYSSPPMWKITSRQSGGGAILCRSRQAILQSMEKDWLCGVLWADLHKASLDEAYRSWRFIKCGAAHLPPTACNTHACQQQHGQSFKTHY